MAYVKLSSFVVFLLATLCMFATKNVEACTGRCYAFDKPPCGSTDCRCILYYQFSGYCAHPSRVVKTIEEHPNLCQSHADCMKKGTGSFCARYQNPNIEHGWCFASNSEAQDIFFKISSNYEFTKNFLKSTTATA